MVQNLAQPSADSESRANQRKKEILQAASRAFRRQGLHATGMRDIADESGMHVGNLYYYFRNKQELLAFCQEQTLARLLDLAELTLSRECPADEKLFRLITGHVTLLNDELPGSLAHLEVEALESPWKESILGQRDRYEKILAQMILAGIETGHFRPNDAGVSAKAILGAVNWTVKWFQPRGRQSSHEIGTEFASLLVRGLLAPGRPLVIPRIVGSAETETCPTSRRR